MSDPVVHWGDAPAAVPLLGREHDVGILNAATERIARLVAITGAGGLGKSTLARVWAESVLERFEAVVWYGFKNRPPLTDAYHEIRQLLAPNDIIPVADTPQAHGNEIVSLLNGRRVLLILDNLETIMQSGTGAGPFEPEYQHLETLLNRVAERTGDGLVLLTSRELPDVIAQLADRTARTVICGLQGLGLPAVRPYLAGSGLQGSDEDISSFAMHHDGNPYAMRLAADYIRFNYPSDGLHGYVRDGLPLPGRVAELLQTQAARLSDLEQLCLLRLAAERAPLPASVLVDELSFRWSATDVRKALEALNVRSLLEPPVQGGLNLQNLLVEFATDLLIRDLPDAVMQASIDDIPMPLACLPLIHPSAPQHVRNAQMNALAIPVAKAFVRLIGGQRPAEEHLLGLLSSFQNASTELLGFAPGTMVNLLLLLGTDLSGRDLSMLPLWHCDFENSDLQDASLCDSDLRGSGFSDILGVVTDVCFDAKGNHLFVATADGLLRGWDAISWQHVVVHAHDGYVRAISYDAAENRLISVGDDRRARIWSADGLEHRYDLDNADRELKAVAIAPGGQVAAIGGQDGLLHLQPLHGGAPKTPLHGHSATVRSVRFLDTESLVSADEDGLVLKWKVGESRSTARYQLSGPAWSVAVAADTIAVGGQRGDIVLLDRDLRERLPHIEPAGAPVWAMAFVEDQLCIATSAGTILCHRLSDGRRVRTIQEHSNWVRAIAAHPRLPVAASGSEDQTVRVFIPDSGLQLRTLRGSARSFWTVAYSADGAMLAAAGSGRSVYVWNNDSSTPKRLRGYPTWIRALRFSPSSPLLAVAGDSGDIQLWDLAGQEPRGPRQLGRHTGPIWSLDFDSAGEWLASAGEDRTVRVWPLSDEAPPGKVVHSHSSWVVSVRYSPDGRALASGAYDGRLLVTTPDGSSPRWLEDPSAQQVWALAWAPTQPPVIIAGGRDGHLRKWHLDHPQEPEAATDCSRWLWSCACARDGSRVWVTGDGGAVSEFRVKDLVAVAPDRTAQPVRTRSLGLAEGKRRVATASDDGVVRVWDLHGGEPAELIPDRQYERLNIAGSAGLSDGQLAALKALGAVDRPMPRDAAQSRHLGSKDPDEVEVVESFSPQPVPASATDENSTGPGWQRTVIVVLVLAVVALALVVSAFFFLAAAK